MNRRVLVVDDDPGILLALETALEDEGYEPYTTTGHAEAWEEMLESDPPGLVLMDVLLAGVDGREMCRRLKGNPATAHVPVILTSALPSARAAALETGA